MSAPDQTVREFLPLLRRWCIGPYGIALGGSYAKGSSDALSDVDVYLFTHRVIPAAQRTDQVVQAFGAASEPASWGHDDPFTQSGTDFFYQSRRVECWLRNTERLASTIAACTRGEISREYVVWAVTGFFNYVALADVHTMRIIEDPGGILERWKKQTSTYPGALRKAILGRFMPEASFWPDNFHYHTAIERVDVIYTSTIVQQVLQALVQVVFALNREYFPGEKKLAPALEKLPVQPEAFTTRLEGLLTVGSNPGEAQLREQQRELAALVAEMKQLISTRSAPAHGK